MKSGNRSACRTTVFPDYCETRVRDNAPSSKDPMTATLPYIRDRCGTYQYERRVPLRIQNDPVLFQARFGGRPLFRRSLRTKHRLEAVGAYQAVDREFEGLIAPDLPVARPRTVLSPPTRMPPARTLTDHDLNAIADRYAQLTAEPFEQLHRRADVSPDDAAELDRMYYELELQAPELTAAVRSRTVDAGAPTIQPVSEAAYVVAEHGFHAPLGSEQLGMITTAIRSGMERGYKRVDALMAGERCYRPWKALYAPSNGRIR